jgi:hypothetical protein
MMAVFWVVVPCSLVEVCRRFRGVAASIVLMMDATAQKTAIVILAAVRT